MRPAPVGCDRARGERRTGKTYTIAALAARYVAEGTPLHELLLVTFTRMATGELRERVRERLVSAEQALAGVLAGAAPGVQDEVVRLLADGPREEVVRRRDRLARALADFDAATIATTHGFCQEVLGGLGVAGDVERDGAFVEDVTDLVDEIVDDLYVRRFHLHGSPAFSRAEAGRIASIAVANPAAPIEPAGADDATVPAMRRRLALAVREELERRKQRMGVMTYDDLLTRLDATLAGDGGAAIVRRLRERWRVVLVDEFQDTDPVQWNIMRRAFGEGTLVLIGDPKQAIYAFRGADVFAYLDAAREAATRATLEVNWRSDQGLIDAYDALFGGARLGHEGIVYRQVRATEPGSRAPVGAPLRIRVVHRDEPSVRTTPGGYASAPSAREHVAKDLAADLVSLLSSPGAGIRPGHVAVLVRTNRNAALVRDFLDRVGIPAVINGAGSVFGTVPAKDWLRLLEAIERPTSSPRARAAALTPFLGWSAERVATAGEEEWEEVHRRLHGWARLLRVQGVASLAETITLVEGLPERILSTVDGERTMTDLRHVGQLLHAAATTEQLGTTALTAWLRRRIAEAAQDTSDEDRSRRLESDAEAVQVLTIHRSKGLEFPVVYCPDLWEPTWITEESVPVAFHDPDRGDARVVDVGLEGPEYFAHRRQHLIEQRGEDLRLAYVALTRARHQAVVWWAGSSTSRHSALGRLLFARDADGTVASFGGRAPSDADAVARFEALAAEAPGCIGVERSVLGLPVMWSGPLREPAELVAARFDRELDRGWRRTSYSDITAGAHEARVGSEPEETVVVDEPVAPARAAVAAVGGDDALRATPSLLAGMPAGVQFGTFVHRVLEATDFAAADLDAELTAQVAAVQARRPLELGDASLLVAGLRAAIETPLGDLRLRDLTRGERLDELEFEFPLVGGDAPTAPLVLDAIGGVLSSALPADDPLAGYAERLSDPALRSSLRGYVTGSIDLVARVGERFAVVDYKTNWLGGIGEELTAWHYRPAALAFEMERAHYALQALLYTVALHRYLRWRLPGYDAERHLAGVLYLFVRGMAGVDTPTVDGTPCGVFAWRPPGALVEALSDVLDQGVRA
ncbi:MAG TPA: UvrD-helicase domain-containing protein [Solirubrobacteraceae bacterium]|nr:UvrD-helicase domain-containing protein [Solirubrobacteraceae bacterium]